MLKRHQNLNQPTSVISQEYFLQSSDQLDVKDLKPSIETTTSIHPGVTKTCPAVQKRISLYSWVVSLMDRGKGGEWGRRDRPMTHSGGSGISNRYCRRSWVRPQVNYFFMLQWKTICFNGYNYCSYVLPQILNSAP